MDSILTDIVNGAFEEMAAWVLTQENEMKEEDNVQKSYYDIEIGKNRSFRRRIEHEMGNVVMHNVATFIVTLSGYMSDSRLSEFIGGVAEIMLGHSRRLMTMLRDDLNRRLGNTGDPTSKIV